MLQRRCSGILLHITSLPSPYGIGDMGPWAYRFADMLHKTGQSLWQVLPFNPPNSLLDNSPYSCESVFAGNPMLISPEMLLREGLLAKGDLAAAPQCPADRVDYRAVHRFKHWLFERAWQRFKAAGDNPQFHEFCEANSYWLDNFALFSCLKRRFGRVWIEWPDDVRSRQPRAMWLHSSDMLEQMGKEKVLQYLFYRQWSALRDYCNRRGIQMIGDVAMFVAYNSSDVWAFPDMFKLDAQRRPTVVAGYPPDPLNRRGQRWGNPVYDWDRMRQDGYEWWLRRMEQALKLFDLVRVDHFRGFLMNWQIPSDSPHAAAGQWVEGPKDHLLNAMLKRFGVLPIIPEVLGTVPPEVDVFLRDYELPEMRVLMFGFGEGVSKNRHAPHNYHRNCVSYTGTHDTNTVRGWFEQQASPREKAKFLRYVGLKIPSGQVHWEFIRLAMRSVATSVIIPLQDVLGLGEEGRMNWPGTVRGNWQWRVRPEHLSDPVLKQLAEMTETCARA